jgi:hypothetical protein
VFGVMRLPFLVMWRHYINNGDMFFRGISGRLKYM